MQIPETTNDITTDWLNHVLTAGGFLRGNRITAVARELMGAGRGFSSDMARLSVTYERDAPELPGTMIAKWPATREATRRINNLANFYEREVRFYLEVAPTSPVHVPGLIYGEADKANDRYALLLEDCSRYEAADLTAGLSREQARQVILNMADFHLRWWDAADLYSFPWMPKSYVDTGGRLFRKSWEALRESDYFLRSLPPGGLEAGEKIYEGYPRLVEENPSDHLTIQHSDLRADNILFDPENAARPVIIYDWAMAMVARGAGDFADMLGGSMDTGLRRRVEKDLIREYHGIIVDRGIKGYSFDECWHDYLKALLLKTGVPVVAIARVDMSDSRSQQLWSLITHRLFSTIVDNDAVRILP